MSERPSLLLEARDLAKSYGPVVALRSADLEVVPGEVHALLGANGAGKSTLVKLLKGQSVQTWVKLTPQLWDNGTATGKAEIKANFSPSRPPTYSARLQIKPWTTYTTQQLFSCKGP